MSTSTQSVTITSKSIMITLMVLVASGVVIFGWVFVGEAVSTVHSTFAVPVLITFAGLATLGLALAIWAAVNTRLGFVALGLLLVSLAPTGFAYIGNALLLVTALVLAITLLVRKFQASTPKPVTQQSQ